jgi:hypothetical protein
LDNPIKSKYANKRKRSFYFPETNEKICAKCQIKTHINNFFNHSKTQDGKHSWCKNCCKAANQKSKAKRYSSFEGRINTFLRSCKNSSQKRNQKFELTREMLITAWETQMGICAYTGIKMTTLPNTPYSVSVERINSSIGYTEDNTILVCNVINKMKTNLDPELFFEMCAATVNFLGDKNGKLAIAFTK